METQHSPRYTNLLILFWIMYAFSMAIAVSDDLFTESAVRLCETFGRDCFRGGVIVAWRTLELRFCVLVRFIPALKFLGLDSEQHSRGHSISDNQLQEQ